MEWFRFEPRTLRAPEYALASEKAQLVWFRLLNYCVEQENGGVIVGAQTWGDSHWRTICGVRLADVTQAAPLLRFSHDGDLVVWNYPHDSATGAERARIKAKAAAEARWEKERAEKDARAQQGLQSGNAPSIATCITPGNAEQSRAERAEQKEQNTPLTPASGGDAPATVVGQTPPPPDANGGRERKVRPPKPILLPSSQTQLICSRMLAINTLKKRRAGTPWSEAEMDAARLAGLWAAEFEEFAAQMDVLAAFYAPPEPPDTPEHAHNPLRFRRRDLLTLLRAWGTELDRATAWGRQREAERVAALAPSARPVEEKIG